MKKYIEKLKSNKKVLYISIAILIAFVGTTFAYVVAQLSGGDFKLFNLNADTTDQLEFNVDKDLSIHATQFNFAEGAGDLSDQAVATARLKANSTKNTATYTYNVYLLIDKNEFTYTTSDKKTEILLQVTDPNGNNLTELSDLKYDTTLQGFDITEYIGGITLSNSREIIASSSTNYTEQSWTIKVTFINLDTNQKENSGKILTGKVIIQKNKLSELTIVANNIPNTYGSIANMNCTGNDAVYNYKYNEINVKNISGTGSKCNINFFERTNKNYLNDYIMSLVGTTQETGTVIHEKFLQGDYTNAISLTPSEYGEIRQYYSNYWNFSGGTSVTDAFVFNDGEWTSQPSNMTSGQYYHIEFKFSTTYNYQLCYELPSSSKSYSFNLMDNRTGKTIVSAYYSSNSNNISKCVDLENVVANTVYRAVVKSDAPSLKFSIKKASSTQTIDAGYRYEGKNPNNWVLFNDELWRIIGVFDSNTHGVANTNLVKIIRANSIGRLVWNKSNKNDWSNSSLYNLLNGVYYNKQNGTGNEHCHVHSSPYNSSLNIPGNCDYSIVGIGTNYRNMIKNVTWKVGGIFGNSLTVSKYYTNERGKATGNNNEYASEKDGYIGLMYPSDYGYSVIESSNCPRSTRLTDYRTSSCAGQSWLVDQSGWTLSPFSSDSHSVFYISEAGSYIRSSYESDSIFPALYLDDSVFVIDGVGTEANPYIIGM